MTPTTARKTMFRIGILTAPISEYGMTGTSDLIEIVTHFSHDIYVITGSDVYRNFKRHNVRAYGVSHQTTKNAVARILGDIFRQLKTSYVLSKIVAETDLWLFYIGGDVLVIPMILAKLFRKRVLLVCAGSATQNLLATGDKKFSAVARLLSRINCRIADNIVLYSPILVEKWNLGRYIHKTSVTPRNILDFDKLRINKSLNERDELVGFIGHLEKAKGISHFVQAIPLIAEKNEHVRFLIAGDGSLRDEIEKSLIKDNLKDRVTLTRWIDHGTIGNALNDLKLVVIPSLTEGLPNLMLEAMACGTPVLATAVGAITDVIADGETGFIIERDSPECIAANVMRALEYPHLEEVVDTAHVLVKRQFSEEAIVQNWAEIFLTLKNEQ
jgi:glycosyltransferase involved in cell wall biosynthesis